jgi:flagellar basal-body rod protein FlgG
MEAQQTKISVISNNLANVNTTGFKKSRADFQDLLYQDSRIVGSKSTQDTRIPTGTQVGHGVRTAGVTKIYTTGDINKTGNELDLAIRGPGFFRIRMQDGDITYTRAGAFKLDGEGRVVTSDGKPLASELVVPEGTEEISVGEDGTVTAYTGDSDEGEEIGTIELARFINPAGLESLGSNLHDRTASSGEPIVGLPGQNGMGKLSQGFLEDSNVSTMKEMVNMISAQRAYETNSKAVQAADRMLQTTNRMA